MPFAQLSDLNMHYEIEGAGQPLLLSSGTGYPGATWRSGVSQRFAANGFQVVTYDHRGVGRSEQPEGDYTTRRFAADAVELLDHLSVEQAHILGHSMGGRVAQWIALDNPNRVRSLVLAASGPGAFDASFEVTRGVPLHTAEGLIEKGYERYIREQIAGPFFFTPEFVARQPAVVQQLADDYWNNRPPLHTYLKHVIARQQHQTADRLSEISAPTLVIVGDDDTVTGGTGNHLRQSQYLAEHIPHADLIILPGVAHAFFWEAPDETVQSIVQFLRRH